MTKISVIVPIFNDWDAIPQLLECLERQTIGCEALELLLVDNGSDQIPHSIHFPSYVRIVSCEVPGSYAARNAGIREAVGEFFAFTDADCRPEPDWIRAGVESAICEHGRPRLVAGHVRVVAERVKYPTAVELHDVVAGLPQRRYVSRGYAVTANLIIPKKVIQVVGEFDSARFSGGDAEYCRRAVARGFQLVYCACAVVEHPARRSWVALANKRRRVKGGQITSGPVVHRLAYAARTFSPPFRQWGASLAFQGLSFKQRCIIVSLQGALWLIEVSELVRLILGGKPRRT